MSIVVEQAFLPAAMAVEQTPPSPLGRAVMWTILLVFISAVTWASLGTVDIVAVAPGHIIPSGHSKRIQPLGTGIVAALPVQDGQPVQAGEVVMQLDTSEPAAELARLDTAIAESMKEQQRAETLLSWGSNDDKALIPPVTGDHVLLGQWQTYREQLAVTDRERRRETAALEATRRQRSKLEALLPITTRRAADRLGLAEQGLLPEADYLDAEQARIEQVHELAARRAQVDEIEAAVAALDAKMQWQRAQFHQSQLERAEQATARIEDLAQQRRKAQTRLRSKTLRAPVDGVIEDMAIHGVGEVVTPAQAVMAIVPKDRALEVEANLRNRDVGFVSVGQDVEIKVDAFPFTRHGAVTGEVLAIASEAVVDEGGGMVYRLRIALDDDALTADGKSMRLLPGMTVAAEIRTGDRRLISYVLSPLLRYADESARER